jgi:hypothetical protein
VVNDKETVLVPTNAAQREDESQDARDYLGGHAAKWLIEKVNRVRRSPRFENALGAITACATPQVREHGMDLAGTLAALACIEVYKKRGRGTKSLEKLWAIGTGKTWKALGEFPDRLRRVAKEVEQINMSPLFAPAAYVNVKTIQADIFRKRLEQLPGIMNFYATGLEMHMTRVPKYWDQAFPPSPQGPSQTLLILSYTVKVCTGKWRDTQVADLLNAAAIALAENREFEALTIAQARARFKKRGAL